VYYRLKEVFLGKKKDLAETEADVRKGGRPSARLKAVESKRKNSKKSNALKNIASSVKILRDTTRRHRA